MERSALTVSLFTPDVAEAVSFYVDRLGFRQTGSWAEGDKPPLWAEVARDGPKGTVRLWFFSGQLEGQDLPTFSGLIYLFVGSVDAEAKKLDGQVDVLWGPEDQVYGLRELGIRDLNGYMICFAEDI
jgi:catechol 2,3-dioxygenase-like lactoylglutathione lyase family enzyme